MQRADPESCRAADRHALEPRYPSGASLRLSAPTASFNLKRFPIITSRKTSTLARSETIEPRAALCLSGDEHKIGCARTVVNKRRLFGARGALRQGNWSQVVLASQEDRAHARTLSSVPKK